MTNPTPYRAVLFDLDGTLLDSFPAHFHAYMALFRHYRIPMSEESFFAVYSPNWLETYRQVGLPRELWEEADLVWMDAVHKVQVELFPGAREVLRRLGARYRLGLVTSGSKDRVLGDLDRCGIRALFEVIVTGGDVQRPKPDPQGAELALEAMRLHPAEAVYVGDTPADRQMARSAGLDFIGIPSRFAALEGEDGAFPLLPDLGALAEMLG